ncbi:MAG: GntR family transcriptional regulator [Clostridia bacterium]|nr:GntR family transcriptional regulator [Clostridia bacterium]
MFINFEENRPIFLQIAEMLEDSILSGAYAEESQIPSITDFAVACKINPATALKGVNLLVEDGLLYKKRGLGMFVSAGARQKIIKRRMDDFYLSYIMPLLAEAERLGVERGQIQEMIERGYADHGN